MKVPPPLLEAPPHEPAWCLLGLGPLLCSPERRLSSLRALLGGLLWPPQRLAGSGRPKKVRLSSRQHVLTRQVWDSVKGSRIGLPGRKGSKKEGKGADEGDEGDEGEEDDSAEGVRRRSIVISSTQQPWGRVVGVATV